MSEFNCYLCQEPKSVVGHNTQSCPNVKCKKCGQKGHIFKNCPNLNLDIEQKLDHPRLKEIHNEKSLVLHNDTKILNSVENIDLSNDIKANFEVNDETLKVKIKLKMDEEILFKEKKCFGICEPKSKNISGYVSDMNDPLNNTEKIKRNKKRVRSKQHKSGAQRRKKRKMRKQEELTKTSGIDQIPDTVDPIISSNKEIMNFFHNIDFSNDIKSKLDDKEEPLDIRGVGGCVNLVGQVAHPATLVDPIMQGLL